MNSSTRRPKGKSAQEIASHQEEKAYVDFVYQTNQTLQSHGQSLIGLSLTYEKKIYEILSEVKNLEIKIQNLDRDVRKTVSDVSVEVSDRLLELGHLADEIHTKTEDIYDNFATLDDVASVQLAMEDKFIQLDKENKLESGYFESSIRSLEGRLQAQIDELRRCNEKPDTSHKQCAKDLQNARKEDLTTIKGLQLEIDRLKKQTVYNQKQFEHVVDRLKKGNIP